MRRLAFFLFCGFFPLLLVQAQPVPQTAITGYVLDAQEGDSLVGVNVFVAGTTLGAATDANGFFRIDAVPFGNHELVASIIGYRRQVKPLLLDDALDAPVLFQLMPDTLMLANVEVQAIYPKDWKRNLHRFKDLFIGTMDFARDCEILNPEVLDFIYEDNVLHATASAPLEVENRALGYRVTFHLSVLQGNLPSSVYSGQGFFTELEPKSDREARRWRKNRLKAYRGSLRHFLSALVQDHLDQDNFQLFEIAQPGLHHHAATDPTTVYQQTEQDFLYVLDFFGALYVLYRGEDQEYGFKEHLDAVNVAVKRERNAQYSWLTLNAGPAIFDAEGRLRNSGVLTRYGYWGWEERMAMTLPWNFDPKAVE
ncbi:MAG TPA: carboxypeptidase-like regulatory domain-containing protein [Rhodothermales bacterium]|nr:carboxypeptidase-like regulatory domain-containing protein [Rhodothermales bacterium]